MTKERRIPNKITTSDTRAFLYILLFGGIIVVGGLVFLFGWNTYVDLDEQTLVLEETRTDANCDPTQDTCQVPAAMEKESEEGSVEGDSEGEGMTNVAAESDLVKIFNSQENAESHLHKG